MSQFRKAMKLARRLLRLDDLSDDVLCGIRGTLNSYLGYLGNFRSRRIIREILDNAPIFRYFVYSSTENKLLLKKDLPPSSPIYSYIFPSSENVIPSVWESMNPVEILKTIYPKKEDEIQPNRL